MFTMALIGVIVIELLEDFSTVVLKLIGIRFALGALENKFSFLTFSGNTKAAGLKISI